VYEIARGPERFEIDSRPAPREGDGMASQPTPEFGRPVTRSATREPVHICERCGERMDERKCKIICPNCGYYRDCSDP
jgi:ribosomal protein L37E